MIGNLLLAIVGFGLAGGMVNRLYVGLNDRQIKVKWVVYTRTSNPWWYWIIMFNALFGLCAGLVIGVAGVTLLLG